VIESKLLGKAKFFKNLSGLIKTVLNFLVSGGEIVPLTKQFRVKKSIKDQSTKDLLNVSEKILLEG